MLAMLKGWRVSYPLPTIEIWVLDELQKQVHVGRIQSDLAPAQSKMGIDDMVKIRR
jgi:hypothetical protein